ncbi:alpha/beta fold hydrolase [Kribbella sp. NPDC051587]|uniref:alpha/beta fold hydrolase n=1 Tax=Kribbella sp. NPDC051587 TaxID=3364119 RepID=UPI00378EF25F
MSTIHHTSWFTADQAHVHSWRPEGDDKPEQILYLHGLGPYTGFHAQELAELLAEHGSFDVYAPDLPGFGQTPAPAFEDHAPDRVSDWLVRQFDDIIDGPVHVVGHSWGGEVAVHLAERHPGWVQSVALLDGGHVGWDPVSREEALADAHSFDQLRRFSQLADYLEAVRADRLRWTPQLSAAYERGAVLKDGYYIQRQRPETFAAIRHAGALDPVTDHYPALQHLPVLLAMAEDAAQVKPFRPEQLLSTVEDFTWFTLPACTHFMIDDAAPRLAPTLAAWWHNALTRSLVPETR